MQAEIQALHFNDTWSLILFHHSMNVVSSHWLYKIKYRFDGNIERYKAHLVTRGFSQQEDIDYFEIFNPFIKQAIVRLIFMVAVYCGWKIN